MKKYTVYLFDFDYTLVDSSRGIVMCFRHVLDKHGYGGVTDDEIKRTIGKTLEESFALLSGVTDAAMLQEFRKEYVEQADMCMTAHTIFFPEVKEALTTLKKQGAKLGVISTKYRYRIHEFVDLSLGSSFFDIIVGGEDVLHPKPHPEGILQALQRLGCKAEDCLYLGDSTVDAMTASAAGVDFAGVLHGATSREELEAYPYVQMISGLEELLRGTEE